MVSDGAPGGREVRPPRSAKHPASWRQVNFEQHSVQVFRRVDLDGADRPVNDAGTGKRTVGTRRTF